MFSIPKKQQVTLKTLLTSREIENIKTGLLILKGLEPNPAKQAAFIASCVLCKEEGYYKVVSSEEHDALVHIDVFISYKPINFNTLMGYNDYELESLNFRLHCFNLIVYFEDHTYTVCEGIKEFIIGKVFKTVNEGPYYNHLFRSQLEKFIHG